MTTHSDDRPTPPVTVSFDALGELIAALPAMLGFVPQRSLVVMCLDTDPRGTFTAGTVMRHDLDIPVRHAVDGGFLYAVPDRMMDVIGRFAAQCHHEDVHDAIAFVVDDRAVPETGLLCDTRFQVLGQCLMDEFAERGTDILRVLFTPEIAAGSEWASLDGYDDWGTIPDPRTSPLTLAYALEGRSVLPSRAAFAEVLRPVDDDVSRRVSALMPQARAEQPESDAPQLTQILQFIQSAGSVSPDAPLAVNPTPDEAARIGIALNRVMVRDSVLALVLTDVAYVAEMLWSELARVLPAPERATAATLLAFSAYARGDGATATVALDIALEADAEYSLATLLERSLAAGAGPELIREVAFSGYATAELCGVELPLPLATT
ncbi:DUF4192 domain-containing protein [Rhodococcoides kyotonense]|nr:DUF4192 domain-containing protein [Rhodococcus kyotonensis]